jgi:hypothetical protein
MHRYRNYIYLQALRRCVNIPIFSLKHVDLKFQIAKSEVTGLLVF